MSETPSKMQAIIDRAEAGLATVGPNERESIIALIDAVKLLSRGQAQTMGDLSRHRSYGEIPIGGGK